MTTVLNRDSIKVKRDLQRRIENYVIQYCETLEENFKQYSIESYKRNIENPNNKTVEGYKSYYQEQLEKIENGTANLYKFDYKSGKKFIKYLIFNIKKQTIIITALLDIVLEVLHAFIDKNTGEVYKPASWKAPAKHVRFDLRLLKIENFYSTGKI